MSTTILTTGGQIPGSLRRERRCAKNACFVKAKATAWVIRKTSRKAEKVEMSREPLKRSDCKRVTCGARGWKSHGLVKAGEFSLSGREAATLLVCLGIPALRKAGDVGTGRRPSTAVIPRPKPFRRVSLQGECRFKRRESAELGSLWRRRRAIQKAMKGASAATARGDHSYGDEHRKLLRESFVNPPIVVAPSAAVEVPQPEVVERMRDVREAKRAAAKEKLEALKRRLVIADATETEVSEVSPEEWKRRELAERKVAHGLYPVGGSRKEEVVQAPRGNPLKRAESPSAEDFYTFFS